MFPFWLAVLLALWSSASAQGQSVEGDIRLVDPYRLEKGLGGRVELYYNGEWGTVCEDGFSYDDALVVCQQLGFRYVEGYGTFYVFSGYGMGSGPIWLANLNCSASGTSVLRDCTYPTPIGSHNCTDHNLDIWVECRYSLINGEPQLRLVQNGLTSPSFEAGRLEIFINGRWGTICGDAGFKYSAAKVACYNLGYSLTALQYGSNLGFGSGSSSQPIWLDNVDCSGFFDLRGASLIECNHDAIGSHDCDHSDDLMINCGDTYIDTSTTHTSATHTSNTGTSNSGVIIGSVVGVTVTIIILVIIFVVATLEICVFADHRVRAANRRMHAANSSTSRRTVTAPSVPTTGYTAFKDTDSTATSATNSTTTRQTNAATVQQQPALANTYQPVQAYGKQTKPDPEAQRSSSQRPPPPAYSAVQQLQQYPPPTEDSCPTDQQPAPSAPLYPGAGDPAAGYPVQGYPQQN